MPAPTQHNQCFSHRPIVGSTRTVSEGAKLRTFDPAHDKDWAFDRRLQTAKFRKPRVRRLPDPFMTIENIVAELKRRGVVNGF